MPRTTRRAGAHHRTGPRTPRTVGTSDGADQRNRPGRIISLTDARRRRAVRDALDWLDHHGLCACWTAPRPCPRRRQWVTR